MKAGTLVHARVCAKNKHNRNHPRGGFVCPSRRAWSYATHLATTMIVIYYVFTSGITHDRFGKVQALSISQQRAVLLTRIRKAMALSKDAQQNITAAENACEVFETVFSKPIASSLIPTEVLFLSKSLYASCLVRIGKDIEAVTIYDSCLEASADGIATEQAIGWRLSKAKCLQRLLRYGAASEEYSRVVRSIEETSPSDSNITSKEKQEARIRAATCILRNNGDLSIAKRILSGIPSVSVPPIESLLLSSCIEYLQTGNCRHTVEVMESIFENANDDDDDSCIDFVMDSHFLYRWILAVLKTQMMNDSLRQEVTPATGLAMTTTVDSIDPASLFLELIRINTSPLDDPDLLLLDDKIELHKIMSSRTKTSFPTYWPEGFILPDDKGLWKKQLDPNQVAMQKDLWISKSRSGYGSHGNKILNTADVDDELLRKSESAMNSLPKESCLLQRMVHPLLLLNGFKFSLRIYVVFFSSTEAYISTKGLVKLASSPLQGAQNPDPSMHMTNSGRETTMRQEGLEFLWKEVDRSRSSSECTAPSKELWTKIRNVTLDVLLRKYSDRVGEEIGDSEFRLRKQRREALGIPKILGLDFVVDDSLNPWLIEVNRFPGLEPRDEDDRTIKYKIVRDAWIKASERFPSSNGKNHLVFASSLFDSLLDPKGVVDTCTSLERLE